MHEHSRDRRIQRTRRSVMDAFAHLAREHPYDAFTVGDVLKEADVGRSTFYAHYRSKDDVLLKAFGMFHPLLADSFAAALRGDDDRSRLEFVLEHFAENRLLFRRLTTGPAAAAYTRSIEQFAALLQQRLEEHCRDAGIAPPLPLSHLASGLARALLGMIATWLEDREEPRPTAEETARTLLSFATGATRAALSRS